MLTDPSRHSMPPGARTSPSGATGARRPSSPRRKSGDSLWRGRRVVGATRLRTAALIVTQALMILCDASTSYVAPAARLRAAAQRRQRLECHHRHHREPGKHWRQQPSRAQAGAASPPSRPHGLLAGGEHGSMLPARRRLRPPRAAGHGGRQRHGRRRGRARA